MNNENLHKRKLFSTSYQPKNRRQSTKFLTELMTKGLNKKSEIIIQGINVETGEKCKVRIVNPSKEAIVTALLQKAAAGDVTAIREVFNRIEGLPVMTGEIDLPGITRIGFEEAD